MTLDEEDQAWMEVALGEARKAEEVGEVPVGAVLVQAGAALGKGFNRPIAARDPTAHAEVLALRAAGQSLGAYRLPSTTLYVTLEPCIMCVGAAIHARVERIVFGAPDPKGGALGSVVELSSVPGLNHRISYKGGIQADQSATLLREFFRARRRNQGHPELASRAGER